MKSKEISGAQLTGPMGPIGQLFLVISINITATTTTIITIITSIIITTTITIVVIVITTTIIKKFCSTINRSLGAQRATSPFLER